MLKLFIKIFVFVSIFTSSSFAEFAIQSQTNTDKLKINIFINPRCMFGDFDALRYDLIYSKNSKILLSLISIDNKYEKTYEIFKELSGTSNVENLESYTQNLLTNGENLEIDLPKTESTELYRLVICKDSNNKNSCKDQNIKDINSILALYKEPVKGYISEDHIYYYQPIIINSQEVNYLADYLTNKDAKEFEKYLKKNKIKTKPEIINNTITLSSLALEKSDQHLRIKLPTYSAVKCGQSN